jgi:hypothetical protein
MNCLDKPLSPALQTQGLASKHQQLTGIKLTSFSMDGECGANMAIKLHIVMGWV